jgi:aspartyl-tRNA(Asn)/glutamyl-tRNA(Gln) amidotransferase subunit A
MNHLSLATTSAVELVKGLREGTVRAVDLLDEAEDRHRRFGDALNAYKLWLGPAARAQAHAADAALKVGADLGPAQGLPISIKDVFGVHGTPTYCGTPRPLPPKYEAEGPIVTDLRGQLAVFPGKSHTVPFAFGVIGVNKHWGSPRNPWDASAHRMTGGSSSGAGGSLWEGSCLWALGSDAGGSVRAPAALTGTVGLRTSIGRWPVGGVPPLSPTFDTPGLLARSVEDLIVGFAAIDPHVESLQMLLQTTASRSLDGLRIGIPEDHFYDECGPGVVDAVRRSLRNLEAKGATLVSLSFPEAAEAAQWMANGGVGVPEGYALVRSEFPEWVETLDPTVWSRLSTYGAIDVQEYLKRVREIEPARVRAHDGARSRGPRRLSPAQHGHRSKSHADEPVGLPFDHLADWKGPERSAHRPATIRSTEHRRYAARHCSRRGDRPGNATPDIGDSAALSVTGRHDW